MFDAIAPRYDLVNRIISLGIDRRWRARAVDALALPSGARALDLATGTGDLAMAIARRHPDATVIAVDPSRGMLAVGARKVTAAGLDGRVSLREGAAEHLPVDDASVDGVTIAFGIRNVADRNAGLREMARVTRTNGRVVILELSDPRPGPMAAMARFHIHTVVPWLGATLSGARAYRYLHESIAAFPAPDAFAAQMSGNGLRVLDVIPLTFGVACLYVATPARSTD